MVPRTASGRLLMRSARARARLRRLRLPPDAPLLAAVTSAAPVFVVAGTGAAAPATDTSAAAAFFMPRVGNLGVLALP